MWICVRWGRQYEDTSKNTQWRKVKKSDHPAHLGWDRFTRLASAPSPSPDQQLSFHCTCKLRVGHTMAAHRQPMRKEKNARSNMTQGIWSKTVKPMIRPIFMFVCKKEWEMGFLSECSALCSAVGHNPTDAGHKSTDRALPCLVWRNCCVYFYPRSYLYFQLNLDLYL